MPNVHSLLDRYRGPFLVDKAQVGPRNAATEGWGGVFTREKRQ